MAGTVAALGADVPRSSGLSEGDQIVVDPNWGDGRCRQCHEGNEQLCTNGKLVGFGPPGGLTGRRDVDAVLDCAGAEESLALGFAILAAEGALTSVGLIG